MKILIVAATYSEIAPFLNKLSVKGIPDDTIDFEKHQLRFLITGVGMVATAYALGTELSKNQYDLAINIGIAGSFSRKLQIGQLVEIDEDIFSELGAEDDEDFLTLEEMQLGEIRYNSSFKLTENKLTRVRAITVNKVHGNEETIEETIEMFTPKLESMEGAAFFYACEEAQVSALQIRSVSNYVEKRNKNNWNIPLAVKNLNDWLPVFLKSLV
ncbi:futalosine hydrolase [Pseudopedobacter beijingensis]|uniref:Futalosine hydrolase n=1 Tax=Pseudopedobacter beijingensis TaxID=1207056 RepID=A0ABW4IB13_9SPHI